MPCLMLQVACVMLVPTHNKLFLEMLALTLRSSGRVTNRLTILTRTLVDENKESASARM